MTSDRYEDRSGANPDPERGDQGNADGDQPRSTPAQADPGAARGKFTLDELTNLANVTDDDLVRPCDIRGILHSHSSYTDGAHSLAEMADIAAQIGLEYLGVSDHFESPTHRDGLDLEAVCIQRGEVDRLQNELSHLDLFQGVELDANLDGTLALDDETLGIFDYVIVSFPPLDRLSREQRTELVAYVAAKRKVTLLGLPIGDWMLRGDGAPLDLGVVLAAAREGRTAVEVNANPTTLPLDWKYCLIAQEMGVRLAISPNAHRAARLVDYRHGAEQAHAAGLCCGSILNTLSAGQFRDYLKGRS